MEDAPLTSPLIAAASLRRLLGTPAVLVVDCRFDLGNPAFGRESYSAGHIPGAVFAAMEGDLAAPRAPGTGRHPLPSPAHFAAVLGRWGLEPGTHVVAYDQASGAWAARLWWMLRAVGHRRVQVLDGGFEAWLAEGGESVTAVPPAAVPTQVPVRDYADVLIDGAEVADALARDAIVVVDARAADRFAGRNETIDPVAGHVPGARSMPFTGNLGAGQRWLDAAALRERWQPLVKQAGQRPLVAMCGSGITACHNLLALAAAGFDNTRLYAGSWSQWIADPSRPVAAGDAT